MKAKEYLSQIRIMDIRINNKIKDLERLKEMSTTLAGFSFMERVQTSKETGDTIGDTIAKIVDLQHEINKDIHTLVDLKKEIIGSIEKLADSDYIDLLYKRYVEFKKWEQIAVDMNYYIRSVYKIHGRALEEISKILKEGTKRQYEV